MATNKRNALVLFLLLLCQIQGLWLFLCGFFPLKTVVPGNSSFSDSPCEPSREKDHCHRLIPAAKFDRLVVVLIDSLRADFVLGKKNLMPYLEGLIDGNMTMSYTAKAHSPTVTLPRIKALVTGSIPGFVDVVLNSDSSTLSEDNIINQFIFTGKKIVFYGDDTWIKLFPNHFLRSDGTTSFYVNDYTEVDDNVTRHVPKELQNTDWDVMVLHYLGLDHIGHIAGPLSPLAQPKLLEMDQIIQRIHKASKEWDDKRQSSTLLVVCGDHGMSDGGSHGGASASEVMTPLVFTSSHFSGQKGKRSCGKNVDQIDLAATLSVLFGLPIPQNSVGRIIPDFLEFFSSREKLRHLQLNAHQLHKIYRTSTEQKHTLGVLEQAHQAHKEWLEASHNKNLSNVQLDGWANVITKQYVLALGLMNSHMTSSVASYDHHAMGVGLLVLFLVVVGVTLSRDWFQELTQHSQFFLLFPALLCVFSVVAGQLAVCSRPTGTSKMLCGFTLSSVMHHFVLIILLIYSSGFVVDSYIKIISCNPSSFLTTSCHFLIRYLQHFPVKVFIIFGMVLYLFSLLSSSFIEEEQQVWYFLVPSLYLIIFIRRARTYISSQMGQEHVWNLHNLTRVLQTFFATEKTNMCTQKFDDAPAINDETAYQDSNLCHCNQRRSSKPEQPCSTYPPAVSIFVFLVLHRILRAWNQTGVKWVHLPDIGDYLNKSDNILVLSATAALSLSTIVFLRSIQKIYSLQKMVMIFAVFNIYIYRVTTGSLWSPFEHDPDSRGILPARLVYLAILCLLLFSTFLFMQFFVKKFRESARGMTDQRKNCCHEMLRCLNVSVELFSDGWLLLGLLLLRPHNIPLVLLVLIQENFLTTRVWSRGSSIWTVTLSHLWMAHSTYFVQGNSNSLTTIDLTAGYVGLQEFRPVPMVLLTTVSIYWGFVWWMISLMKWIVKSATNVQSLQQDLVDVCWLLSTVHGIVSLVYCTSVFFQRYHLFVWTVFAPKLMYLGASTVVFSLFCVYLIIASRLFDKKAIEFNSKAFNA